jgi:ribosomal protein L21E
MQNFNVGDHVTIIESHPFWNGKSGIVERIYPDVYIIKIEFGHVECYEHCLMLTEIINSPLYKVLTEEK